MIYMSKNTFNCNILLNDFTTRISCLQVSNYKVHLLQTGVGVMEYRLVTKNSIIKTVQETEVTLF